MATRKYKKPENQNQELSGEDQNQELCESMPELPEYLITDIVSMLPSKAILSWRCVSKFYYKLLTDHKFGRNRDSTAPISLVLQTRGKQPELYLVEVDEQCAAAVPTKLNSILPRHNLTYAHSCNGLLCIFQASIADPYYICNPLTGECLTIPKFRNFQELGSSAHFLCGFGFSPISNHYKLIHFWYLSGDPHTFRSAIYTLGTSSWRLMQPPLPCKLWAPCFGVFVGGAIHWLVADTVDNIPYLICSLLVEEETWQLIQPPAHFGPQQRARRAQIKLGALGGCLAIYDHSSETHFDIWMRKMEENIIYGSMVEVWVKGFVIEYPSALAASGVPLQPLEFLKFCVNVGRREDIRGQEILMVRNNTDVVAYDPRTKTFRNIETGINERVKVITHRARFSLFINEAMVKNSAVRRAPYLLFQDPA